MSWGKVDDKLHGHPKARKAGVEAMGLWVLALSYCAAYLTDGFVPEHFVYSTCTDRRQRARMTRALVGSELWHEVDGGWQFKDWSEYQPTKAQVLEEKEKKAEAGRRGGLAKALARAVAPASADSLLPYPSRPVPKEREERETLGVSAEAVSEVRIKAAPVAPEFALTPPVKARTTRAKSTKVSLPPDFDVSPDIERICREENLPDPHVVIRDFRDKAIAKAYLYADWEAAFRSWMRSDITARSYPKWEETEIREVLPDRVLAMRAARAAGGQ